MWDLKACRAHSLKTTEEAELHQQRLQRTVWFCAWHFITGATKKADCYHQTAAQVSLQLVPVVVDDEQVSEEKILKCGEAFFQTPTCILNYDIGVAFASRVGSDPATTVSSAMMNLKGFSLQSVSAVI